MLFLRLPWVSISLLSFVDIWKTNEGVHVRPKVTGTNSNCFGYSFASTHGFIALSLGLTSVLAMNPWMG